MECWPRRGDAIKSTLAPNPSKDSFSLTSAEMGATVRLHDIRGRLLRSVRITSERQPIDIADLDIGVYLVRVNDAPPQRLVVAR
ncbi:MAG: T9SS type A sorting domain-containing protein [Flavobacteriales bacterium]|nr:MAG: T9SS type A sorting domain-containing protein [Flavobacteriales bacterium]